VLKTRLAKPGVEYAIGIETPDDAAPFTADATGQLPVVQPPAQDAEPSLPAGGDGGEHDVSSPPQSDSADAATTVEPAAHALTRVAGEQRPLQPLKSDATKPLSVGSLQSLVAEHLERSFQRFGEQVRADLAAHTLGAEALRAAVGEAIGAVLDGQAQLLTESLDEQRQARLLLDGHEQQTRTLLMQEQRQLRVVLSDLMAERDARERALMDEAAALRKQVVQLVQQVADLSMALEQQQRAGEARARQEQATTQEMLGGVRELLAERQRPRGLARLFGRR
jgi:hypothetical protein